MVYLVALLAEGVDRNCIPVAASTAGTMSPSSRRAWIEICAAVYFTVLVMWSPSSRRAWIEISLSTMWGGWRDVAHHPGGGVKN